LAIFSREILMTEITRPIRIINNRLIVGFVAALFTPLHSRSSDAEISDLLDMMK
jgi:hypothetical protein